MAFTGMQDRVGTVPGTQAVENLAHKIVLGCVGGVRGVERRWHVGWVGGGYDFCDQVVIDLFMPELKNKMRWVFHF